MQSHHAKFHGETTPDQDEIARDNADAEDVYRWKDFGDGEGVRDPLD